MMIYKGYSATVEFDEEDGVFFGEVIDTRDVITFEGTTADEIVQAFHDSVDDYLAFCAERGEEPDKPFSGRFVLRVSPTVHRRAHVAAKAAGKSLNAWVAGLIETEARRVG